MYQVIIVAGGTGSRMQNEQPKQFLSIDNEPIIIRSIKAFYHHPIEFNIIVACLSGFEDQLSRLCEQAGFQKIILCEGGDTRFQSVKNALNFTKNMDENDLILVHDAARPFVGVDLIERICKDASRYGNAIPVIQLVDSIRQKKGSKSHILDRTKLFSVQTPQAFIGKDLKQAYQQVYQKCFTDDASVFEAYGMDIYLTDGAVNNIKITTPFDLLTGKVIARL